MTEPAHDESDETTQAASHARPHRAVRSFVVRAGRMTPAQERALHAGWPRYGLDVGGGPLDLDSAFGRVAPRVLEIGFGNGDSLLELAAAHPERDHLGIEVHPPGVGHLLLRTDAAGLSNLRVVCADAVEVLKGALASAKFDEVLLYFPDPWPKTRHHKRRIVQPDFVALVADRLRTNGVFRLATDWTPYAEHMLATLQGCAALHNLAGEEGFVARPESRPVTRFERRGQRLGHAVHDLAFRRR